jgi:signal transduction histidine kinase
MLSEISNDTLASMIKANPEFEVILQSILADYKKTTSMLVHELRNPLSLLKGTLQYIEMKHPETKEYKYWDQLQDLINDMEHIMQDASMLNNSTLLNKENTDLIGLIHSILSSFMPQAMTDQIDLSLQVEPDSEVYFSSYYCDSGKLKQVLTNMIKNAFEATEQGDYIRVSLEHLLGENGTPQKLSIAIANSGKPIPIELQESIFQPFVSYKKGGTGVGLALAKKVIDLHYGSISVTSDEAQTAFTILLPL